MARMTAAFGLTLAASMATTAMGSDVPRLATQQSDHITQERVDAEAFFEALVARYQRLEQYEDSTTVVEVTERCGEDTTRVETRIECEITDGELRVETPQSQLRQGLGLNVPLRRSEALDNLGHKYDLWLAPHMTLRFSEEPLKEFRPGVAEGFRATEAEHVVDDDGQHMVHLELRSDTLSNDSTATFDLFINPESMLIERIVGEQRLPTGIHHTTVEIEPTLVTDEVETGLEFEG